MAEKLERAGKGLNLSKEVLNGFICHTKGTWPYTREGCVVRYADHIAYMNHDIEDAMAAVSYTHLDVYKRQCLCR